MLSGTKTVTFTTANTFGCAQASMYVDNALVDTISCDLANGIRTFWTFTLDTTKFSGTIASPGTHTLKLIAYDVGGNTGSFLQSIIIAN